MFEFFDMVNNYEERKVENTEITNGEIDTCAVSDSEQPYETGISHREYNDGEWIIVEMYETKEQAKEGHKRWVDKMSSDSLPNKLVDVSTSGIAGLLDAVSDDDWNVFHRKPK